MKPAQKRVPSLTAWVILLTGLRVLACRSEGNTALKRLPKCWSCAHLEVGHLDFQVKWMRCRRGHRLIPPNKLIYEHHLFNDPGERIVRTTIGHWTEIDGSGPPRLGQPDCEDWTAGTRRIAMSPPSLR